MAGMPPAIHRVVAAAVCVATLASCSASRGRYTAEHFRTTRTNFVFVRDRVTKQWVNRRCELRVATERKIPDPLETTESGTLLSVQLMGPGTAQSGGLNSIAFDVREDKRVWAIEDVLHEDDLDGRTSYQLQVQWPHPGAETQYDPAEIFYLPPLGDQPPNTWGPWVSANKTRPGAMAWWDETTGQPPAPPQPIAYPFELRCQIVFTDTPGVVR